MVSCCGPTCQLFISKIEGKKMKALIKKKLKLFWKGWVCSLFIALIVATSFKSAIADWNVVPTGSMKPTILEGDRIFINKLAYDLKIPYTTWHVAKWNDPQRGDIVIFYSPADGKRLVKRVIGVPGDLIAMENNRLIINGKKIKYEPVNYLNSKDMSLSKQVDKQIFIENLTGMSHPLMISTSHPLFPSFNPIYVPKGKYFMMGDIRDNSADSRYFGFVGRSEIVGQAISVVVSFDTSNTYRPRWERFFTKLP
jgi:signal peptidase I